MKRTAGPASVPNGFYARYVLSGRCLMYQRNLCWKPQTPQTDGMRLPYGIIRFRVVRALHFLKISVAILLSGMTVSASAANSKLVFAPARLGFGNIVVGRTQTYLVAVTNTAPTSVTISGLDVGAADFTTSGLQLPLVLPSEKSVDLSVSFTPTRKGWTGGPIRFSSSPTNSI